jgi:proline iminopeptidase
LPLLESKLTTVYLEPVGTGASGLLPDGDYGMKRYAYFARALIDLLGVHRPHFLGHSHGGCVGLQLAIDNPGGLGGLILYDSGPVAGPELHHRAAAGLERFARRHAGRPGVQDAVEAWGEEEAIDKAQVLQQMERMLPVYFADYWSMEKELGAWKRTIDITIDPARKSEPWDARPALGTITDPVLIIAGQHDFIGGPHWARQVRESVTSSRLVVLHRSGHFGHIEEPYAFAQAVADFVR